MHGLQKKWVSRSREDQEPMVFLQWIYHGSITWNLLQFDKIFAYASFDVWNSCVSFLFCFRFGSIGFFFSCFQFYQKKAIFKNTVLSGYIGNKLLNNVEKMAGIQGIHKLKDYRYGAIRWSANILGIKSQKERHAHRAIETTLMYFNKEEEEKRQDADAMARLREEALKGVFFCVMFFFLNCGLV